MNPAGGSRTARFGVSIRAGAMPPGCLEDTGRAAAGAGYRPPLAGSFGSLPVSFSSRSAAARMAWSQSRGLCDHFP